MMQEVAVRQDYVINDARGCHQLCKIVSSNEARCR